MRSRCIEVRTRSREGGKATRAATRKEIARDRSYVLTPFTGSGCSVSNKLGIHLEQWGNRYLI